jgi:drug/metabolite transporter (DMT)-like permease
VKHKDKNPLVTFAIVTACSVCFCSKGVLIKLSFLANADPLTVLALRMAFAFPVFLVCALVLNWRAESRISKREWGSVLMFGLIGYYFSPLVNFAGLQYVSVGLERMILYTYPTFVVMGGLVFFGQRVAKRTWIAVGLTYIGIVIAYSGEVATEVETRLVVLGAVLILMSAISYSFFVLFSSKMIARLGAIRFTANVLCVSCLFTFIHYILTGRFEALATIESSVYKYAMILAVFGTVVPSFLLGVGLRRAGAQQFAVLSTIGPVATVVLAWAFLGESVNAAQLIGLMITLSGGVMISLFKAKKTSQKPEQSRITLDSPTALKRA